MKAAAACFEIQSGICSLSAVAAHWVTATLLLLINSHSFPFCQPTACAQVASSPAPTTNPPSGSASLGTGCATETQTAPTRWTNIRTARAGRAGSTSSPAATASAYAAHTGNRNSLSRSLYTDTITGNKGPVRFKLLHVSTREDSHPIRSILKKYVIPKDRGDLCRSVFQKLLLRRLVGVQLSPPCALSARRVSTFLAAGCFFSKQKT